MIIKYKNTTYIDLNNKDKGVYDATTASENLEYLNQFKFDSSKYDKLCDEGKYSEAINYARKYQPNNPQLRRQHNANLANLRLQAITHDQVKNKALMDNRQYADAIDFQDSWRGNAISNDNSYGQEFNYCLRRLGSKNGLVTDKAISGIYNSLIEIVNNHKNRESYNKDAFPNMIGKPSNVIYDNMLDNLKSNANREYIEATKLRFSYMPSTRVNAFGWDWTRRDNTNTLENKLNILKEQGVTKADLEADGFVFEKDTSGMESVVFSKDSRYAPLFIVTETEKGLFDPSYSSYITSYDAEGNVIYENIDSRNANIYKKNGYTSIGFDNSDIDMIIAKGDGFMNYASYINDMKRIYKETKDISDDYFKEETDEDLLFNSFDEPPLEDYGVDSAIKKWALDETFRDGAILTNYPVYSNLNSLLDRDTENDKTLYELEQEDAANAMNVIMGADYDDLLIYKKCVNGVEGVCITKKPKNKTSTNYSGTTKETQGISVWIPGFLPSVYGDVANTDDIGITAMKQVNEMKKHNYSYTTERGETIAPAGSNFMYIKPNNEASLISTSDATNIITKDILYDQAPAMLYSNFVNADGGISDEKAFEETVKRLAVRYGNDMYDSYGAILDADNNELDIDELFKMRAGNDVAPMYKNTLNQDQYAKLLDIYDIYLELMKTLNYFNNYHGLE